jgi:hypothetical protein
MPYTLLCSPFTSFVFNRLEYVSLSNIYIYVRTAKALFVQKISNEYPLYWGLFLGCSSETTPSFSAT